MYHTNLDYHVYVGKSLSPSNFINKVKTVVDWIGFLVLVILAMISVQGSWDAYSNGMTSWTIEQKPVTTHPTLTLCLGLSHKTLWYYQTYPTLGIDFNISFTANSQR